jgi:aldose 1-epimerase
MIHPINPISAPFGQLPDGRTVEEWTLAGSGGLTLRFLTYGGIVTRLHVPDRRGRSGDVVLGFASLDGYLSGHPYFGAITGRVAGRVTGARFTLDGQLHELAVNDPPNHLHGGNRGFDKQIWQATPISRPDGSPSVCLSRVSHHGEENYPGNVSVSVTYTVTAENAFVIETEATSDRATPFSLTHHSYINLAGERSGSIGGHTLQIHADQYAPTDEHMTLLGHRAGVTSANNFKLPVPLADALPRLFKSHGDLYFINRQDPADSAPVLVPAARLVDPVSGRVLSVLTTEDCLQLYTGVSLDGTLIGKSGGAYGPHAGVCLECEGYPDGANQPIGRNMILRPGHILRNTTIYAFSTC